MSGLVASGGQGVLVFTLSTYLQFGLHQTPSAAGLRLIPIAAGTFVFSSISGRAVARFGVAPPLGASGVAVVLSAATLLIFSADSVVPVTVATALFGAGFGLGNAPIAAMAMTGMGPDAGTAGGVVTTSRQLGISIGVACAGAVSGIAARNTVPSWTALAICGVALVGGAVALHVRQRRESVVVSADRGEA